MVRDNEDVWCESMVHQLKSLAQSGLFSAATLFSPSCRKFQYFLNCASKLYILLIFQLNLYFLLIYVIKIILKTTLDIFLSKKINIR